MPVIHPSSINTSKITITPVRVLPSGAKQAYLNHCGSNLELQCPTMRVAFDMLPFEGKYSVQFSLDKEPQGKMKEFMDALELLKEHIIDWGVANAGTLFKMNGAKREVIEAFFSSPIKISTDKDGNVRDYPPMFKASVKRTKDNEGFDCSFFEPPRTPIEGKTAEEILKRGAMVTPVVVCTGVWISAGKFGLSWKLNYARVEKFSESGTKGMFLDDESDTLVAASGAGGPSKKSAPSFIDETTESDEASEDVMAAVMPVKSVVKKPVSTPTIPDADDTIVEPTPVPKVGGGVVKKPVVKKIVAKA